MNLSETIAAALDRPGVTSTEIAALIEEAEAELAAAGEARAEARRLALDPSMPSAEVDCARAKESEAAFLKERMSAAIEKLRQGHELAVAHERETARQAEIAAIEEERDALARELTERYPQLASGLADLLHRVRANNERCRRHLLRGPEHVARDLRPSDVHFLVSGVRLPPFDNRAAAMGERIWPPPLPKPPKLPAGTIERLAPREFAEEAHRVA